jgi:hypothetical protein
MVVAGVSWLGDHPDGCIIVCLLTAFQLIGEGARKTFSILVHRTSGFAMQTTAMEGVTVGM